MESIPAMNIRVVVEIKGLLRDSEPVCPAFDPSITETTTRALDKNGSAEFNQMLGPFAPIRTHHAKVIFYILDSNTDSTMASVAALCSASVAFSELTDQEEHVKVLNMTMRGQSEAKFSKDASSLTVVLSFKYSKISPLKKRIYQLQDEIRSVEQQLAKLKTGKS